jgi:transcriptional regulator with XRE-family HTH domain
MQYDYERFLVELGARVKQLRKERKLSHRRMVTDFGFHLGQLAKIESGGSVSAQTLLKLCAAFDLKLEDLVRGLGQDEA